MYITFILLSLIYSTFLELSTLDSAGTALKQYLEIMKRYTTGDVEQIPDGVYRPKRGLDSGIYIMLQMLEELSREVYWRFLFSIRCNQASDFAKRSAKVNTD